MAYTVLACSYYGRLFSTTRSNSKATPTNDIEYSCHIKAVILV